MKLLQKGPGWNIEAVCNGAGNGNGGCGAKLLVEERDIFRTESHSRDETDVFATFKCCECGVDTDLPRTKVPTRIWNSMQKRPQEMVD